MFDALSYLFNKFFLLSILVCYEKAELVWAVSQMSSVIWILLLKGPHLVSHFSRVAGPDEESAGGPAGGLADGPAGGLADGPTGGSADKPKRPAGVIVLA